MGVWHTCIHNILQVNLSCDKKEEIKAKSYIFLSNCTLIAIKHTEKVHRSPDYEKVPKEL